mmetsp:Transcript_22570/g.64940  ORF Transcript_22570/g.64940 Transcript_22570/m.64940 type:complete len:460 (+) Transcript_22570:35-1414(+)
MRRIAAASSSPSSTQLLRYFAGHEASSSAWSIRRAAAASAAAARCLSTDASAAAASSSSSVISASSPAVVKRVESMVSRHDEIVAMLNTGEHGTSASLGKELSRLAPVANLDERIKELRTEKASLMELLTEAQSMDDAEMEEDCTSEMERIDSQVASLESRLVYAVLPRDEDDLGTDAVLEVRAGTGGDEAALFAAKLLAAYEKTAKDRGWKFESLGKTLTDLGGIKEAAASINSRGGGGGGYGGSFGDGDDSASDLDSLDKLGPYGLFKFESGVHRVQRVPVNDVRIHTSAASVAVLPAPDDSAGSRDALPMSELRIDTMRASGAGGQHVNTTESAIRITHIPTGITASIQDERSQHKNKATAMKLITARVRDKQREEEARERGDAKANLMGGGDRSERIRTYNFPQDRVTDHRCKHSEHGISKLFDSGGEDGLVSTFAPYMRTMNREELLKEMEGEE